MFKEQTISVLKALAFGLFMVPFSSGFFFP